MALAAITAVTSTLADLNQYKQHLEGQAGSTLSWFLRVASSQNFINRLSDAGGAQKFSIQDSGGVEVASIDSDGDLTISGSLAPAALTIPTASAPTSTTEGVMQWDTDDDHITVGDGANNLVFPNEKEQVVNAWAFGTG